MFAEKFLLPTAILLFAQAVLPQEDQGQRPRKLIRIEAQDWQARHWREMLATGVDILDFDARQKHVDAIYQTGPQQILAQITAPIVFSAAAALAPESFTLHYNTTGQAPFDSVTLSATGNADGYAAEIAMVAGGKRIYYFISAADENGRTGYAPRSALAGDLFSFYVPVLTFVREPVAKNETPQSFALRGFPNPFRDQILLEYDLPARFAGAITLEILNVLGQRVRLLAQSDQAQPGRYQIAWNGLDDFGKSTPAGVYFYRLRSGSFACTQKVLLVR